MTEADWVPIVADVELDDYRRWFEYKTSAVCSMFGMTREQLGLETEEPTVMNDDTRKRLATMLGVDDLRMSDTTSDAVVLTVRLGRHCERVVVEQVDLLTGSASDVLTKTFFQLATAVKIRVQQAERRRALQDLISTARWVEPVPMELPSSRVFETEETPEEPCAPKSRFEAIVEEMKNR